MTKTHKKISKAGWQVSSRKVLGFYFARRGNRQACAWTIMGLAKEIGIN